MPYLPDHCCGGRGRQRRCGRVKGLNVAGGYYQGNEKKINKLKGFNRCSCCDDTIELIMTRYRGGNDRVQGCGNDYRGREGRRQADRQAVVMKAYGVVLCCVVADRKNCQSFH